MQPDETKTLSRRFTQKNTDSFKYKGNKKMEFL